MHVGFSQYEDPPLWAQGPDEGPFLRQRLQFGQTLLIFGPNSGNNDYSYVVKEDEVEIPDDLNKASDDVLNVAKAKMDVKFEENRLRPGDEGFVWDKQIDFDPPQEASEWDDWRLSHMRSHLLLFASSETYDVMTMIHLNLNIVNKHDHINTYKYVQYMYILFEIIHSY